VDALAKLQELYTLRETTDAQIQQIEQILGSDPADVKVKRKRGPNKPKELPPNTI
jgi:hypothetical protein